MEIKPPSAIVRKSAVPPKSGTMSRGMPGTYPENISIKRDPARRAVPKSEPWAVGEGQVQMKTVNIIRNYIAG